VFSYPMNTRSLCFTLIASAFTLCGVPFAAIPLQAADPAATAAEAVNSLGIDLLKKTAAPAGNALLSPYSIQTALAMTYAGASGVTRDEMARTLHFPKESAEVNDAFAALRKALEDAEKNSAGMVADSKRFGGPTEPVKLSIADRLFGQQGYDFREAFLAVMKGSYDAPFEPLDFKKKADAARNHINGWVADRTQQRICDLIPPGALTSDTRLVLVNAIYMKAPWAVHFDKESTRPGPFRIAGKEAADVPTMFKKGPLGYAKRDGYAVVTLPYVGSELQLLILLPDDADGLPALEAKLTPAMLAGDAQAEEIKALLYLPKFKLEPPTMALAEDLKALGMKTAFDIPRGSANFDLIAPRKPDDYLCISDVFHKAFLSLDENGTEAAAATAVVMMRAMAMPAPEPKPVEIHVDHPFLFAIQHRQSGACIFLGRVTDPR